MADVVCAGHICLDIIPAVESTFSYEPGKLVEVGAATVSTGGCVANTGLALQRLGVSVEMCGRLGDDAFGHLVLEVLQGEGVTKLPHPAPNAKTSYTVVVNPPDQDRMFLHFPGANIDFGSEDIPEVALAGAKILHLGYPPILRRIYSDNGSEACRIFDRAHEAGAITSLDMTFPDTGSEAGRIDWRVWLAHVLPHCDLFTPSAPELAYMLRDWPREGPILPSTVRSLAETAIEMGVGAVMVKNGADGLYVRARPNLSHPRIPKAWAGVEHFEASFDVDVAGTTGAGDATVAGLLLGLLRGSSLPETAAIAAATGACSVERPDAVSGIPNWDGLRARMSRPWRKRGEQ